MTTDFAMPSPLILLTSTALIITNLTRNLVAANSPNERSLRGRKCAFSSSRNTDCVLVTWSFFFYRVVNAQFTTEKGGRRFNLLEAGVGIEPAWTALQAAACLYKSCAYRLIHPNNHPKMDIAS